MSPLVRRWSLCIKLTLLALVGAVTPTVVAQSATTPWLRSVRAGDVVYFAFTAPARIERYDLAQEQWLTTISLATAPTAFHVDDTALYLAYERTVVKRAVDGTNERPLYNSPGTVAGILTDASYVFAFTPGYSTNRIDSIRKSDGQFVATWYGTYSISAGFSIAPGRRRIFGVNTATTSFATIELAYNADGSFGTTTDLWSDGNFSDRPRTWVSPAETTLVRSNGLVYSVPGLTARGSLAGGIDDAAYHGTDVLVALRGNKLVAFDNVFLESGSYRLATAAGGIAVRSGQIYAFATDAAQSSGFAVMKVAVASLTAAQPGAALDPVAVAYVPDDVVQTEDGSVLLLSKKLQSIFRWSPATRSYTASYPLLGTPVSFAYSPTLRRIFTTYAPGAIYQIRLDGGATVETPFANLTAVPSVSVALDDLLFVAEGGSYYSYKILDRNGAVKTTGNGGYSSGFLWSSTARRLYFMDFSRLNYLPVDANGLFGTGVSGPYDSNNYPSPPLRLSTDGASILGINGLVYRTSDLAYAGTLSNGVTDAASRSGAWVSVRPAGSDTQLQVWTSALFLDRGLTIPRVPYRIFTLADGRVLTLTTTLGDATGSSYSVPRNDGRLVFSVVDLTGAGSVTSSPYITAEPASATVYRGRSASLSVVAQGESPSYQWRRNGAVLAGATNATLSLANAQDTDAGSYLVVVSNPYGAIWSAVATVTVQDLPPPPVINSVTPSGFAALGGGFSFSVNATGTALAYQWRKGGVALPAKTNVNFALSPLVASDFAAYDVVVSNPGGSATSAGVILSQATPPTITSSPLAQTIALGGTASFAVTATGTPAPTAYRWFRQPAGTTSFAALSNTGIYSGALSPTLTLTGATLSSNGDQFRCVVTNGFLPDATSASAALTVSAAPVFTSAASTTFLAGVSGSFVVQAAGSPAPTFAATGLPTWAALNATTGVLSGTPPSGAGSPFSLTITATNGTAPDARQVFSLNVQAIAGQPTITTQPFSQSVGVGAGVTFAVIASGSAPLTYQWQRNGAALPGATLAAYAVAAVALTDAGRYSVVVSNGVGSATSQTAILSVVPAGMIATHTVIGPGYVPGGTVTVSNRITFSGMARSLGWQVLLPTGWSYAGGGGGEGDVKPVVGTTELLEWLWSNEPVDQVSFTYTLQVPPGQTMDKSLSALVTVRLEASPILLLALADPLVVRPRTTHSADSDGDGRISLFELTRVVELYNVRHGTTRNGHYRTADSSEDGFAPDSAEPAVGAPPLAYFHSGDSNRDGKLSLFELTRVIQLYNTRAGTVRTGTYRVLAGSEDGFAPAP